MQVTVLMPVYNAERYLYDSISSILRQTSNNWKLICVDDGSTDNSLQILRNYEKANNKIKVLTQENAGPAVARARAIEIVDTEYVSILDADDAYTPDYVERMLKRAEETDADCVVPDVEFGYGGTKKIPNIFVNKKLNGDMVIHDGVKAFAMTIPWRLHGWQMIRTTLAKQYYTIDAVSYSKFNSDEYITRLLYLKSKVTALCDACYLYRIGEGSITRTPSLKMLDGLQTLKKLILLIQKERLPTIILLNVYNEYYASLRYYILMSDKLPETDKTKAHCIINEEYHKTYRKYINYDLMRIAPFKSKLKFLLSLISLKFICC